MKTAYIYIRGLYTNQTQLNSIENQKSRCSEYAKTKGYRVKELFIDRGDDVNYSNRPELRRMFKAIEIDPPSAVICISVDRIFRNMKNMCEVRNYFKKKGVKILSVNEGGDVTNGLIGNIFSAISQYESEVAL